MFKIKFPTKRIFRILRILRVNRMMPFCDLFIERPSYICSNYWLSVVAACMPTLFVVRNHDISIVI